MEIKEVQIQSFKILERINKKSKINHDPNGMLLSLAEEVGEVARELSKKQKNYRGNFNKEDFADELADVISRIFVIAEDNKIDMNEAFIAKLNKIKSRFQLD